MAATAQSELPKAPAAASKAAVESAVEEQKSSQNGDSKPKSGSDSSEIRTVFNDPQNFNVKHPLYNSWTLWFDNPSQKGMGSARGSKDSWGEDLNKVVDFDSVEEFWGLYNNIIPPSELPQKANYYMFKEGIKPAWEDPANTNGGKWSIQLPRDKTRPQIDRLWLFTMLSAIGETLESPYPSGAPPPVTSPEDELVTGVIMSARANFYRISIWTRRAEDNDDLAARLLDIGKHFKTNVLGYNLEDKVGGGLTSDVEFQSHKESEKKRGKKTIV
ncbi:eukaryotic translation initiation factor 4E [Violaceomyces palustris]|uniref:Eukaryotic translation initiation factor 4E n=1 Tax=Violaceomyces palustris TaxID=1673888 RepID=A0ACD0NLU9_9BASI|nr:eukaryotic translation initiation factor 4E [Violaceomyces palustris]